MTQPDDDDTKVIYRDSATGKIVTREYAEAHPRTTQADTVPEDATPAPVKQERGYGDDEVAAPEG